MWVLPPLCASGRRHKGGGNPHFTSLRKTHTRERERPIFHLSQEDTHKKETHISPSQRDSLLCLIYTTFTLAHVCQPYKHIYEHNCELYSHSMWNYSQWRDRFTWPVSQDLGSRSCPTEKWRRHDVAGSTMRQTPVQPWVVNNYEMRVYTESQLLTYGVFYQCEVLMKVFLHHHSIVLAYSYHHHH